VLVLYETPDRSRDVRVTPGSDHGEDILDDIILRATRVAKPSPEVHRHCEEPLRRSNPSRGVRGFGLLRSPDGALRRAGGSQ
jgi:hypothetical protein